MLHKTYKNGNPIDFGKDGDHVKVRAILATGLVPRVDNFGPLHEDRKIVADQVIVHEGYELHVVHCKEAIGFSFGQWLTTATNVNDVYYQRLSK